MSLLLALVSQPIPPVPPAEIGGAGSISGKKKRKYRVNGKDYDEHSPELVKALQEALNEEKESPKQPKKSVIKIAKGVPVYRVEFPEYPRFEAKMQEVKWQGNYEVASLMREMLQRQRDRDEEEAIIALLH